MPMSPALSRLRAAWRVASVAFPFMYPLVVDAPEFVKEPPLLHI